MSGNAIEIIRVVLGGAGVAIIAAVGKLIKDARDGRTAREDTTIKRWQELANEHERNSERAWGIVAAYRRWYTRLWAAYVGATNDRDTFPTDPTHQDENA